MAPPGGQEDTLLAGILDEEGMQTGVVVYLADHLLKPSPDIDETVNSTTLKGNYSPVKFTFV